ncbi:MAG: hypothetical protein JOY93_08460 [Acidobacteriales bacterium]|nr:hypothetical protein [Terriglobales bacterium]
MRTGRNIGRRHRSLVTLMSFVFSASLAFAHPMGNFSINHYSKIKIAPKSVDILYLIDMAEIPTYQEMRRFSITPQNNDPTALRYVDLQAAQLKQGLALEDNGRSLELATISRQVQFAEGAGGLPTMKLAYVFRAELGAGAGTHKISYHDNNFPGRAGWKEIAVVGAGSTILDSTAPSVDRSNELSTYSSDALNSPPQQLSASVDFTTGPPPTAERAPIRAAISRAASSQIEGRRENQAVTAPKIPPTLESPVVAGRGGASSVPASSAISTSPPKNTPRSRFTDLISSQNKLSFWVLLSTSLIAAGLGALHALEPGHGKTIVAAYLVGSRGTARHAFLLGIVVTAAHTAGVYLLGGITLYASRYIVPEQLYPWLGAISGLSVAGLGVFIFLRHLTGETGDHSHAAGVQHSHWFLSMFQQRAAQPDSVRIVSASGNSTPQRPLSLRELCLLGITGGIVPCPAALVVLLSAFSLHRIGFGLFLITAFSFGLAAVLVIVGLTMVYTKQFMASRVQSGGAIARYLPLFSSAFMVVLGVGIIASAFASIHIGSMLYSRDKLVPFVTVVLLGLFLGMRHSTDPDHVAAVSTIVSRQKSLKGSASIGLLWGLGHTLTIFLVGAAIIVFGVVIPPRLGLSMEFCVALMLILLGIFNLAGLTKWITEKFTPEASSGEPPPPHGTVLQTAKARPTVRRQFVSYFDGTVGRLGLYQTIRPLIIGLVHGLAGSAAVALLVLSTIKTPLWATAYLLVFGFGTMLGMMIMTTVISLPLVYAGKRLFNMNRHLTTVSGLASMAFGMFLVYHIGLVDGLFTSHPHWIPQ